MISNPLFALIPIQKYDPYVLGYCIVNICLALLCIVIIVAIRQRQIAVVVFCHWISCCTLIVDAVMIFVFANIMSSAHTSLYSHIRVLHEDSKELCPVWDNAYHVLSCCPPIEVLKTCEGFLNVTRMFCPTNHSNDCYVHLKKWLHSNTEIVGCLAFCVITPLKLFMIVALRKDIEKVEMEMAELEYFSLMINDYDRHGDGYIESFKSNANLTISAESNSTQSSRVSRARSFPGYSPFVKHSVIEEVENEFTVRGDEIREELHAAIAAHNARQQQTTENASDDDCDN
uniref:Tetraspanin n=1 Tax=Caenorhabditis japonica TaxID=281687 RepID=A0A8R1HWC1_CAEJA